MSLRYFIGMIVAVFALALATAPATAVQKAPKSACKKGKTGQIAGAVAGGLLGGFLGNRIDGGRNRGVGTVLGAVGGAFLGSQLGKKLDKCEKERVTAATMAAVQDNESGIGQPQKWVSDTRPNEAYGTAVASRPTMLKDGRQCRAVSRVSYIAGEEVRDQSQLCRKPPETAWGTA